MTAVTEPSTEERLDRLSAQMDFIVEELQRQRETRERIAELTETLTPVTKQAMQMASDRLRGQGRPPETLFSPFCEHRARI